MPRKAWGLELAERCTSMSDGTLTQLPVNCSTIEQPVWMLDGLETARSVWFINVFKGANHRPITEQDDHFMKWVLAKD